jgi:hypothetical protein
MTELSQAMMDASISVAWQAAPQPGADGAEVLSQGRSVWVSFTLNGKAVSPGRATRTLIEIAESRAS